MLVPPTTLSLSTRAMELIADKAAASNTWSYAIRHREKAVVVGDEAIAGELLVAAAVRLGICLIIVLVEHGDADYWRQVYQEIGASHGAQNTIPHTVPTSG